MKRSLPRIAVLLDENTSGGGTRYESTKTTFSAIRDAGGLPFGIPYCEEMVRPVISEFDGLLSPGGRFAFPHHWYIGDCVSRAPQSERLVVERAIMQGFLEGDKPILGICSGMQMLACLGGCKMAPEVGLAVPNPIKHDQSGFLHTVSLVGGTILARMVGTPTICVNTLHREAVCQMTDRVVTCAIAEDGIIEAIEIPDRRFAIGLQWHQEAFAAGNHPANVVFARFIEACCGHD